MIARSLAFAGLAALLLPALPVATASAASFDCAKAGTAYERAICVDPALSALDETLAVAYATAIGGLSKDATETMRRNQRAWVAFAERACSDSAQPLVGEYSAEDRRGCLHSNLYNRIHDLEQSRMLGGWRFYMTESFSVLPADTEESGAEHIKVATKIYSSTRLDGTDPTARAFNAFVEDLVARMMAAGSDGGGPDDGWSDIDARTRLESATPQRITLKTVDWWYGHGAAHGNYTVSYAHFLTGERRALVASDVFAGEAWVEPVATLALEALRAKLGENLWDDLEDSVRDAVGDVQRWTFSDEGLVVQFQPYEVTAYAAGAPTVTIPWMVLDPYMAQSAYSIVY